MLLVVNISKRDVSLDDLGLTLKPKQAVDLDKCNIPREKSVHSSSLNTNMNDKKVRILQANPPLNSIQYEEAIVDNNNTERHNKKDVDIDALKTIVSEEIQKQINSSNTEVIAQLSNIAHILQNSKSNINDQDNINNINAHIDKTESEESDIDMKTLMEIHSKNIDKLSKNTKSKAKYVETKTNNNIDKTVSELEDLMP